VFERFTNSGRRAIVISQQEARALGQQQIGPLHLLLGVLTAENGTARSVLASLDVGADDVRRAVAARYGTGEVPEEHIPFSEKAKTALEHALRESLGFGHVYIGTEHVLIGLLTDDSAEIGDVLAGLGAQPEAVRDAVLVRLGSAGGAEPAEP
jgi:ATP-dependent Clp protease ATP-binding subunit ClpA